MDDSIRLNCAHCGAGLKAPAKLAGKTLNCPKCQQPIEVPSLVQEIEEVVPVLDAEPSIAPAMQICPHCHAQIPATASKCRHCGEFVQKSASPPSSVDNSKMHPVEYAVAVLLAPIGVGIGAIWSIQKLRKATPMLLISVPMTALLGACVYYFVFLNPGAQWSSDETVTEYPDVDSFGDFGEEGGYPDIGPGGSEPALTAGLPDLEALKQQPEPIQRAMRANVRIELAGGVGSGVIVKVEQNAALILTNRHVVDEVHAGSRGQAVTPLAELPSVTVTYITGEKEPGKVLWLAPDQIDLAVVRAFCPAEGVRMATWNETPSVNQGEDVFAVGNPAGLGWTLTRGTVSALRQHNVGEREIPVIQTDTAINPGNSGGGLYTSKGDLVGINDFILDPSRAQRLGFAIHFNLLNQFKSKPFELSPPPGR